jgi:hypothetical protein
MTFWLVRSPINGKYFPVLDIRIASSICFKTNECFDWPFSSDGNTIRIISNFIKSEILTVK